MKLQVDHSEKGGKFFYEDQDKIIGELTYFKEDENTIHLPHTYVDPAYRHHGLARKLVDAVVSFANERSYTMRPTCSYIQHVLTRTKQQ